MFGAFRICVLEAAEVGRPLITYDYVVTCFRWVFLLSVIDRVWLGNNIITG